ncbi:S-methyl thiohydantoin desulfurase domain-containing protein [Uliginosibacterium sp. H1]|uniref:S-methyl thiohydantoin desulfurase domain-containing protein n=1 Tax=Uliginosibacterium sp. H1 TaxID=3114757 RepID=UPI002E17F954|nr:DUF917 family protein [Uliginosibacterium sp. H1]
MNDIYDAAAGAAILGSGGGGGYQDALMIINQLAGNPDWSGVVPVGDYDGSSPCSVIFMMGSPDAAGQMSLEELSACIGNALTVQTNVCGFTPTCTIPIETGPINSLAPVIAAALNLGGVTWVVDGDGAGRAVPELPQTTYAGSALPVAPCVVADNATVASQMQSGVLTTTSTPKVESLAGAAVKAFGSFAGVSMWQSASGNGYALTGNYIPGTLEQSRALGNFLRSSAQTDTATVAAKIASLTGRSAAAVVTNYYITQVTQATSSASLDAGVIRLDTDPDPAHSTNTVFLYNMNENLIAYSTAQATPLIIAPDSICYYSEDEKAGFSNATPDLAVYYDFTTGQSTGKKVSLVQVTAAPQLVSTPGVMESFTTLLRAIGYAGALPT